MPFNLKDCSKATVFSLFLNLLFFSSKASALLIDSCLALSCFSSCFLILYSVNFAIWVDVKSVILSLPLLIAANPTPAADKLNIPTLSKASLNFKSIFLVVNVFKNEFFTFASLDF